MSGVPKLAVAGALALALGGCRGADDEARERSSWIHARVGEHSWYVREALNGTANIDYFDGWYTPEHDPTTGGGWRWMDRRSITRLRTRIDGASEPRDMTLTIYGWTPWKDMDLRTSRLEFTVNGHVLETFDPPHESFVHELFVPKGLLGDAEWVDFVITAANTAQPRGDWRDLGFCTTGFLWTPAPT